MILYSDDALADLAGIRDIHGQATLLMLLRCCEELAEPSTRIQAVRLGGDTEYFRLRVHDFNILFDLHESPDTGDRVRIVRVRQRR